MSHLEAEGFSLLDAACGSDALKIVRALPRPLDLLLTDVLMPNMTGPELARQLIASNPALKVISFPGCSVACWKTEPSPRTLPAIFRSRLAGMSCSSRCTRY